MELRMTLAEVLESCDDWEFFCKEEGFNEWAVNEGGGSVVVTMTMEKAIKYGIILK